MNYRYIVWLHFLLICVNANTWCGWFLIASSGYMEKSYWYSIPNLAAHRYKLYTFRELAKRCMKNTYAILMSIDAFDEQHLNLIFVDMLSELLPHQYFYQVVRDDDIYADDRYACVYASLLIILLYIGYMDWNRERRVFLLCHLSYLMSDMMVWCVDDLVLLLGCSWICTSLKGIKSFIGLDSRWLKWRRRR